MYKLIQNTIKELPEMDMIHQADYSKIVIFNVVNDSNSEVSTKKISVSFLSYDGKAKREHKIKQAVQAEIDSLNS